MAARKTKATQSQISLLSTQEAPDAFRKAVQAVHSKPKSPLSLLQRKLGNAWLKHAIETQPDKDGWWELGLRDLSETIGFDSNNRQYLKEAAEALMRIVFEWDVIAPATKRIHWKASVLFPELEIRSDVIRYQISSQMRERIVNPDMYAMIDMNIVKKFRRAPSLAIWEFCIRFEKLGQTAEVPWQQFRDMILGESADGKTYQEYKYFKAKVLLTAIAEINAESDHHLSLCETKIGRRIDKLRFVILRKEAKPAEEIIHEMDTDIVLDLVGLGLPQAEAKKLARDQGLEQARSALDYTRRRMSDQRATPLDNPAAYFRQALSGGYAQASTVQKSTGMSKKNHASQPVLDLTEAYIHHRASEAESYLKELDLPEQTMLVNRYNEQQTVASLRIKTRQTKLAKASFLRWLAHDTWGEPTTQDLLSYAQQRLSEVQNQ